MCLLSSETCIYLLLRSRVLALTCPEWQRRVRRPMLIRKCPKVFRRKALTLKFHHHCLTGQSDSVEMSIHGIPPTITNIPTINRQAISLSPRSISFPYPIHSVWIVISRLHLLSLVHRGVLSTCHLIPQHLVLCLAPSAERRLRHIDSWHAVLRLVDGLGLGEERRLLVDDGGRSLE
jgi:hypothetical protein